VGLMSLMPDGFVTAPFFTKAGVAENDVRAGGCSNPMTMIVVAGPISPRLSSNVWNAYERLRWNVP
jgi:hypothetical protein